ncbi:MAG: hypothetical protein IKU56_02685 [Clostridia bacterium]|nr:hypothetical protein [Clostridia bacterium]
MNVMLDVVSPVLVLEELALQALPIVLWGLLVVLLLTVSVAVIRLVLKKLQAERTSQSEEMNVAEDDPENK